MAVNSFNAQNPPVNTKGDLFTFSTIPTKLGVGANNTVLTADSTTATGLKWATVSGGKVLQVVTDDETATPWSTTSLSFATTNLSVSITPSATTSRVLVLVSIPRAYVARSVAATVQTGAWRLRRGTTNIQNMNMGYMNFASATGSELYGTIAVMFVDSPNTTSATTYDVQAACDYGSMTVGYSNAQITVLEIGA